MTELNNETLKAFEITPNSFCAGVQRAMMMINEVITKDELKPFYMLGYLVHNRNVVSYYEDYITVIKEDYDKAIDNIKSGTIIITAHGISPKILDKIKSKNLNIIDTTCPNVTKVHNYINEYLNLGYNVYVMGSNKHPEVIGYLGISDKVKIYEKDTVLPEKTFLTTQTTLIYNDVLKEFEEIKKKNTSLEIILSKEVCSSTSKRQEAIINSFGQYDLYIIIGDKLSNNCLSLYNLVINNKYNAIMINSVDELNNYDIKKYKKIGVTAGASTPKAIVKEVIDQINNNVNIYLTNLTKADYIKFN